MIFINYEHNLVSPVEHYYANLIGKIPMINNPMYNYLVRIDRLDKLIQSEYYIEYSKPNIENIKSCDQLYPFLNKIIYIPPLLCDYSGWKIMYYKKEIKKPHLSMRFFSIISNFLSLHSLQPTRQIISGLQL